MKVLITGSAGFVGRHFHRALDDYGAEVLTCDIKEGRDCRELFRTCEIPFDLVIHCAANVGGRARIDGDPLAVAENLAIDSDMFRWAVRTKQQRVVYFSSSAAYPVELQDPTNRVADANMRLAEQDIRLDLEPSHVCPYSPLPDQTYGWAKLTGEMLAEHARAEGVKVYVFRPFSGYGTDQDQTYPFPAFIARALRRDDPFVIWGDGTAVRDFIHIDDIVAAVNWALTEDITTPVNLCTGRGTSFNELAQMIVDAVPPAGPGQRYRPEFHHFLDKPVGCHTRVGDPSRLLEIYKPRVTLEEGIRRALKGFH